MKQASSRLGALKKDFVAALRIVSREGLSDAFAHLSARLGPDRMLFMPRKSPAIIRTADLFIVSLEKPVPQSAVHQAIYKARPDAGSVIHFHSPAVILLSVVGQTVQPMHNYSAIFYEGVPLFEGTGQVESAERAAEIARLLGGAKAIILRGHGAVVVGHNVPEACVLALYLEESARLQAEAMKLGAPKFITAAEAERIARQTFNPESTLRAWEHFKAKAAS
ncbi:MAG TPA: class II aldolase/adducin family protein [candidate division Zixibacteria bacterium]|nr:class II aldolase/adducin family protein [candidate division Zixibacteria bacterium]